MRCAGCLRVDYCCKEHQRNDWPLHKTACVRHKSWTAVRDLTAKLVVCKKEPARTHLLAQRIEAYERLRLPLLALGDFRLVGDTEALAVADHQRLLRVALALELDELAAMACGRLLELPFSKDVLTSSERHGYQQQLVRLTVAPAEPRDHGAPFTFPDSLWDPALALPTASELATRLALPTGVQATASAISGVGLVAARDLKTDDTVFAESPFLWVCADDRRCWACGKAVSESKTKHKAKKGQPRSGTSPRVACAHAGSECGAAYCSTECRDAEAKDGRHSAEWCALMRTKLPRPFRQQVLICAHLQTLHRLSVALGDLDPRAWLAASASAASAAPFASTTFATPAARAAAAAATTLATDAAASDSQAVSDRGDSKRGEAADKVGQVKDQVRGLGGAEELRVLLGHFLRNLRQASGTALQHSARDFWFVFDAVRLLATDWPPFAALDMATLLTLDAVVQMYGFRPYVAALGVYRTASLVNHSCQPNVTTHGIDRLGHVTALRPLRAGEELLISYLPANIIGAQRRGMLRKWGIVCTATCPLCHGN